MTNCLHLNQLTNTAPMSPMCVAFWTHIGDLVCRKSTETCIYIRQNPHKHSC